MERGRTAVQVVVTAIVFVAILWAIGAFAKGAGLHGDDAYIPLAGFAFIAFIAWGARYRAQSSREVAEEHARAEAYNQGYEDGKRDAANTAAYLDD